MSVFPRMQKKSSKYRKALKKRDKALYKSNIETFAYIIDDYEKNNWVIPTQWMAQSCNHHH
jgi:hypothetical protein